MVAVVFVHTLRYVLQVVIILGAQAVQANAFGPEKKGEILCVAVIDLDWRRSFEHGHSFKDIR